jgi:hypothetical protein
MAHLEWDVHDESGRVGPGWEINMVRVSLQNNNTENTNWD